MWIIFDENAHSVTIPDPRVHIDLTKAALANLACVHYAMYHKLKMPNKAKRNAHYDYG